MTNPLTMKSPSLKLVPAALPMVLHTRTVARSTGGPDKTILRSVQHVDPDHLRIAAAYIHPKNDNVIDGLRDEAAKWHCPLHAFTDRGPIDPRTVRNLIAFCKRQRVTIWHAHDYKTDVLGLIVNRYWPMKLISTAHGFTGENRKTRLYARLDALALRRYDHVIAVSPQLKAQLKRRGVPAERLTYVPNAIDPHDYQPAADRTAVRAKLGIDEPTIAIGVIGRLSIEKGVDRAVRTLARLAQNYNNIELHIIGDGAQRDAIEKQIAKRSLQAQVKLWGWRDDVKTFYNAIDMLLLPSHTEGMPNVVLEAMAMGVPVAATNVGGVRDLLHWGACGVVLDKDDELAWPNHIAPLLVSAPRRAEIARQARQRIENHYTFKHRMKMVTGIYEQMLKIGSPSSKATTKAA